MDAAGLNSGSVESSNDSPSPPQFRNTPSPDKPLAGVQGYVKYLVYAAGRGGPKRAIMAIPLICGTTDASDSP